MLIITYVHKYILVRQLNVPFERFLIIKDTYTCNIMLYVVMFTIECYADS